MKLSLAPEYSTLATLASWLRTQLSAISRGWQREHDVDGTHTTITADSLTTSGDALIGGDLTVVGDINGLVTAFLDRQLTMVEVTGTVAETTVYSFSVPAGTLGTENVLRVRAFGDYLSSGAEYTITSRLKFGGTTILTNLDTMVDSADRRSWAFDAQIMARNSAASQHVTGTFTRGETGASLLPILLPTRLVMQTTTVDTTVAADLVLTVDLENTGQSVRTYGVLVEYWK